MASQPFGLSHPDLWASWYTDILAFSDLSLAALAGPTSPSSSSSNPSHTAWPSSTLLRLREVQVFPLPQAPGEPLNPGSPATHISPPCPWPPCPTLPPFGEVALDSQARQGGGLVLLPQLWSAFPHGFPLFPSHWKILGLPPAECYISTSTPSIQPEHL